MHFAPHHFIFRRYVLMDSSVALMSGAIVLVIVLLMAIWCG